jgi:hypothetical protein
VTISINPAGTWQTVAIFEVDDTASTLHALSMMSEPADIYRIIPYFDSPAGRRWFDASVDFSVGDRRAVRITQALIASLEQSFREGGIGAFRLVSGREWLQVAIGQLALPAGFSEAVSDPC